jgi:AcrR family transcriptional regulator
MPRKKARDEARAARNGVYRQHILDAAERVFAERGYETAKVVEIAYDCGLSMGTIYAISSRQSRAARRAPRGARPELLRLARGVAGRTSRPRDARSRSSRCTSTLVHHPAFLRMHLRSGAWSSAAVHAKQVGYWESIPRQAHILRRGVEAREFVDEDPVYLVKLFSTMDQVLLADWVAGGMKADSDTLVRRLRDMVERALCLPAIAKKRTAAR